MALKWNNPQQLDRDFANLKAEYNQKAAKWMQVLGERVVKYAREHGSYTDRTSNLRNSIGYVVIQSGKVLASNFGNEGGYEEAKQKARDHAMQVASALSGNKTYLVWVAGMEYARYVEAKGFDVLTGSGNWVESTAESLKAEFTRYLMSKEL